jgi:hypothetical protein
MSTKKRAVRPMHAMVLAHHLAKCLNEHPFSKVSDKLRDELIHKGMGEREAAQRAPTMLDGIDRALDGDFDFAKFRRELKAEAQQFQTFRDENPAPA